MLKYEKTFFILLQRITHSYPTHSGKSHNSFQPFHPLIAFFILNQSKQAYTIQLLVNVLWQEIDFLWQKIKSHSFVLLPSI